MYAGDQIGAKDERIMRFIINKMLYQAESSGSIESKKSNNR